MRKLYDREYFDRWYRNGHLPLIGRAMLERRVRAAIGSAEYLLERPVRSVLDVGCGEAPWRAVLRRLRPGIHYVGVDPSAYVARRFGRRRSILHGGLGDLRRLGLRGHFDLVVCCDVLHYVGDPELKRGLRSIARLTGGIAFLETFTGEDDTEGDSEEFQRRSAATYRRCFREAGLLPLGLHVYVPRRFASQLTSLEVPPGTSLALRARPGAGPSRTRAAATARARRERAGASR